MSEEPERRFREHPVSFVRRSGRMSEGQERAYADLADTFLVPVPRDAAATSVLPRSHRDPGELFGRVAPLVVEIGSGQGHAVVHAATAHPELNFLAIEVFRAGVARTMLDADQAGVTNLRIVEANAPEVLQHLLPPGSVDEVWVFFSDPWPKKKHVKRRLVSPGFGSLVAGVVRPGGLLRLATDWEDYAQQMREVLDADPSWERAFDGDWADRFDGRVLTAFERKGQRAGRAIRDLTYRHVGAA